MKRITAIFLSIILTISGIQTMAFASEEIYFSATVEPELFASYGSLTTISTSVDVDELRDVLERELHKCTASIDISSFGLTTSESDLQLLNQLIFDELVDCFHVMRYSYSYYSSGKIISVSPQYSCEASEYSEMYAELIAAKDKITADIKGNSALGDVQKLLLLHDRLALTCEYDFEFADDSYSCYAALVKSKAVCQGYAKAYKYLLDDIGIKNSMCSSKQLNHAWNIVYINGKAYHIDVTWDDYAWGNFIRGTVGYVTHDNFLRSDDGIAETGHTADDFAAVAYDTTYDNYFWQNSKSAFQLIDNELYYIDNENEEIRRYSDNSTVCSVSGSWVSSHGIWGNYACLSSDGKRLLYSLNDKIYSYDIGKKTSAEIFAPNLSGYENVYGFTYSNQFLVCDINDTPPYSGYSKSNLRQESKAYDPNKISFYNVGDIIEFGWYPQSEVTDSDIISELNSLAGDNSAWTSYGYYSGTGSAYDGQMAAGDWMRYIDVIYNSNKYRGVIFDSYRPHYTGYALSSTGEDEDGWSISVQKDNGYNVGTVYWFLYEPIKWRVLDPKTGMVMSETILDSQAYNNYILRSGTDEYNETAYRGGAGKRYYANNYAESSIKQWLNNDFYNTAFSFAQQKIIAYTTLDNSAYDTSKSAYDSEKTNDKIYLPAYSDVLNENYGFSKSSDDDTARQAQGSNYAKSQGLYVYTEKGSRYDGNSYWRLRSAGYYSNNACYVNSNGYVDCHNLTNQTDNGVRPVLNINPEATIIQSNVKDTGNSAHSSHSGGTATCLTKAVCTVCGLSYGELDKNNHENIVKDNSVEATCTKTGLTEGAHCKACSTVIVAQTEIPAKGHNYGTWIDEVAASCTEDGTKGHYTCSVCQKNFDSDKDELDSLVIKANGHAYDTWIDEEPASCTEDGTKGHYTCSVCNKNFDSDKNELTDLVIKANGHAYGTWINEVAATCTEDGTKGHYTCSVCQKNFDSDKNELADPVINALGHEYGDADCTKPATCTRCNATTGGALGHEFSETIVAKKYLKSEATCIAAAVYYKACVRCALSAENEDETATFTSGAELEHDEVKHDGQAATCTEDGWKAYVTCSRCDYTTYEEIDALGHEYGNADCTKPATCTRCFETTNAALGHDFSKEATEVKYLKSEATCTAAAVYYKSCVRCVLSAENEDETAIFTSGTALGHDEVKHDGQAATCTEDGWKAYITCSRCDYTTYEEIDALGHEYGNADCTKPATCTRCFETTNAALGHDFSKEATEVKYLKSEATCTAAAVYYKSCVRCALSAENEDEDEDVTFTSGTALGHEFIKFMEIVDYTCTTDGYDLYKCSRCDETTHKNTTPAAHRAESDYTVIKKATCEADGYKAVLCSVCKEELKTATIAKRGHNLVDTTVAKAATCTDKGIMNRKCDCAETDEYEACTFTTTREIAALGHDEVSHEAKAATCTDKGWNAYVTCSRCDYTTYKEIAALGHDYSSEWTIDKAATVTEVGSKSHHCTRCGDKTDVTEIPATTNDTPNSTPNDNKDDKTDNKPNETPDTPSTSDYILGDIDGDGNATAADARLALRASVGLEDYKEGTKEFLAADVDKDDAITAADARLILRASVGLETLGTF